MSDSPPDVNAYLELSGPDLVRRLAVGLEAFDARLGELSGEQADTAFLPAAGIGRWPVRVVVGHLADAEIVNTHRLRRAVAEEGAVISGWNADAFVDAGLYGIVPDAPDGETRRGLPIAGALATIHTLRAWTCEWLSTLGESQWSSRLMHEERGPFSVRQFCGFHLWHFEHHAWFANRKVEHLRAGGGQA